MERIAVVGAGLIGIHSTALTAADEPSIGPLVHHAAR